MTADTPASPVSEDEMGTHPSRLAKPFILAAPLMAAALIPAVIYGQRSRDVAAEADRALVASLAPAADDTAVALDPDALCDPAAASEMTMTFSEIDLDADNHKASVTGLGFDAVIVDLKGWVDEPSGTNADDIIIRLERSGTGWCVAGVKTRVAGTE